MAVPGADVWSALESRVDLLFDGLPADAWPPGDEQPPFHKAVPWPFTDAAGGATTVSVTLHEVGGGTRVDVRHEGWGDGPAWDVARLIEAADLGDTLKRNPVRVTRQLRQTPAGRDWLMDPQAQAIRP